MQSQPILDKVEIKSEALTYSEVIEIPIVDKDKLFIRGREWFNENFKSSRNVLQIEDKETGELAGKGIMSIKTSYRSLGDRPYHADVSFTMNVWVKDGKYKYEISNFEAGGTQQVYRGPITTSNDLKAQMIGLSKEKANDAYLKLKKEVDKEANLMIASLKKKMAQESNASNW
ncbi:hypothetical protein GCM10011323_07940 [Pontibacter amylolyticus]|uniref:DUF4468 domain-containing protein n=2 Tax=Pontibacter amylolyticus TaxID=1424080 RepID=A0ABQ1VYB3_9BACT|nr:hypothetical protein GCM10011323_07940 [Pontibacter amylolyticus]